MLQSAVEFARLLLRMSFSMPRCKPGSLASLEALGQYLCMLERLLLCSASFRRAFCRAFAELLSLKHALAIIQLTDQ
jgi:hypothetical protein